MSEAIDRKTEKAGKAMKLSQKTCLWKERIDFFGLRKDMSQAKPQRFNALFVIKFRRQ